MDKIYKVLTSFEGHPVGALLVTEPTERLEALVAVRYLADMTPTPEMLVEVAGEIAVANEAEKTASPKRVRRE